MTVFNDILVPRFKDAFHLTIFQAMLVRFAFFVTYYAGSLIDCIISATKGILSRKALLSHRSRLRSAAHRAYAGEGSLKRLRPFPVFIDERLFEA